VGSDSRSRGARWDYSTDVASPYAFAGMVINGQAWWDRERRCLNSAEQKSWRRRGLLCPLRHGDLMIPYGYSVPASTCESGTRSGKNAAPEGPK